MNKTLEGLIKGSAGVALIAGAVIAFAWNMGYLWDFLTKGLIRVAP